MIEIIFKAQRADGKGWVDGSYYYDFDDNAHKINVIKHFSGNKTESAHDYQQTFFVTPETVCQYVWITDDDKNKIFQSDKCYFETEDYFDNENATFSEGYKGEVTIEFDEHGVFFKTECNETIHISILEYLDYKLKLIGNVQDKN